MLEDVSLEVGAGEFVAIAGPNGGGKTTLLRLVLGLERPTAGTVRVFGQAGGKSVDGARIGYLPQRARLIGEAPVTVREVVSTGRLAPAGIWGPLRRADREAVARAIDTVGLADRADSPLRTLSGGMQQRALIAKALASEPTLLALDEPTTGVDAESQESLGAPARGAARGARRHDPLRLARVRRRRARRRPDRARPRRHRLRRPAERAARRVARPLAHAMLELEFMRLALATGAIVGLLAPAVGFFLVERQASLIGDGLGHVAFAGVAVGLPARDLAGADRARGRGDRRSHDRVAAHARRRGR